MEKVTQIVTTKIIKTHWSSFLVFGLILGVPTSITIAGIVVRGVGSIFGLLLIELGLIAIVMAWLFSFRIKINDWGLESRTLVGRKVAIPYESIAKASEELGVHKFVDNFRANHRLIIRNLNYKKETVINLKLIGREDLSILFNTLKHHGVPIHRK